MSGRCLYALYGSLRKGMVNHSRFSGAMEYLETVEIAGFRMFALRHYPYVVPTGNLHDVIIAEIFHIMDPESEKELVDFEKSVGYRVEVVPFRQETLRIFVFDNQGKHPPVPGGDWVRFLNEKRS